MADAMDSKSILRKGVGVRLPSLAPRSEARLTGQVVGAADATSSQDEDWRRIATEVGEVIWARARHVLGRSREEFETFAAYLRRSPAAAIRNEQALARQEELAKETRELGWCLGVVAAAHDLDLLLARREPEGLAWMLIALAEAEGFRLEPTPATLPEIPLPAKLGWRVPLLAAWSARAVARGAGPVRWTAGTTGAEGWLALRGEQGAMPVLARREWGSPDGGEGSSGVLMLEPLEGGLALRWSV